VIDEFPGPEVAEFYRLLAEHGYRLNPSAGVRDARVTYWLGYLMLNEQEQP
jgi:hypothetical protein